MASLKLHIDCLWCKGTGITISRDENGNPQVQDPCENCGGCGFYQTGTIYSEINVFQAYEILECLDATEHAGLTDTQKEGVLTMLACGLIDLNEGKTGRVRLWSWFGAESTTVANLTALLG